MKVVLASRNSHKVVEVSRILASAGAAIELIGLDDLEVEVPEIAETGATFAENALIKASTVADLTGLPALADDSGLCVTALNDMPGILSARWAGRHGDDRTNLELVLDQIADVPASRRQAAFVCVVALVQPGLEPIVVEGRVDGTLTTERHGDGGFGYDPIFAPDGNDRTTAQMSPAEKDELSHRGRALRALAAAI